jgi:hypothetical protein
LIAPVHRRGFLFDVLKVGQRALSSARTATRIRRLRSLSSAGTGTAGETPIPTAAKTPLAGDRGSAFSPLQAVEIAGQDGEIF